MSCKNCRRSPYSVRVDDVRKLYNPNMLSGPSPLGDASCGGKKSNRAGLTCGKSYGKCRVVCNLPRNCVDDMKSYWNKNCDIGLLRAYEDQPWFKNRVVQAEWRNFVDQLVTPSNIGCQACPGPDDWSFKCHKVRSLIGPTIPCVWELPEKDKCDPTQYGINRDWRRYNEDQRIAASDISCGCNKAPICYPKTRCEWPPYLGVKYGPRYMAWAHPSKGNFPRTSTVFNYQSLPQC